MTQELVVRPAWALQPKNVDEVKSSVETLVNSTFVPASYRGKMPDTYACILYGQELGLPQMQALNSIVMIDGRATLYVDTMTALARAQGHQIRIVKSGPKLCTVKGRRAEERDDDEAWQEFTFTIEEADHAGLTRMKKSRQTGAPIPGPWQLYPADMLRARALTRLCKAVFSDVLKGLTSTEEAIDTHAVSDAVEAVGEDASGSSAAPLARTIPKTKAHPVRKPDVSVSSSVPAPPVVGFVNDDGSPVGAVPPSGVGVGDEATPDATVGEEVEASEQQPPSPSSPLQATVVSPVDDEIVDAEIVDESTGEVTVTDEKETLVKDVFPDAEEVVEMITAPQLKKLNVVLKEAGINTREEGLSYYSDVVGHEVHSSKELTKAEASRVIDSLEQFLGGES